MPARPQNNPRPVPVGANGENVGVQAGQQLRSIIDKALQRRRVLRFKGAGHMPEMLLRPAVMRLEQWLNDNPHPSPATVRRFALGADLQVVMPSTAEGRKLMDQYRQLVL
jgi:hypothetical protein